MATQTGLPSRKTIIHVVQHLAPGGIESLALDFLSFSSHKHEVFILSLEGTKEQAIEKWPRLRPYQQNLIFLNKKPGVDFELLMNMNRLLKAMKPRTVHTHHIGPLLYTTLSSVFNKVEHHIHTEHDAWHLDNRKHKIIQMVIFNLFKPIIVADARVVQSQIKKHFSNIHSHVIKNGIDCEKFIPGNTLNARKKLSLPENKFIIGCAGRLQKVKGMDYAIKSLKLLPNNIELAIAGQGPDEIYLRGLADSMKLTDRVHFIGRIDDMPTFYQSLDLFLLPSRKEGFPLSTLEAQACNIPCIASDVGGTNETLCEEYSTLIKPGDLIAISRAALDYFNSLTEYKCRDFVLKNNDIKKMIQSYDQLAMEIEK